VRQDRDRSPDDRLVAAADNVIDLQEWRARRRPETLPREVLDELDDAGRVYEALLAQGHELRFDLPEVGGRVRVELRSVEGELVRPVELSELLGTDAPAGPGAAA
jgi:hypothetical protein